MPSNETLLDDADVCALLRAQTPPARWVVYRVQFFPAHTYHPPYEPGPHTPEILCAACPFPQKTHEDSRRDRRFLLLLRNGPLRHLTMLADRDDELPQVVRNWLHTLLNIAVAAGVPIDGWAAYDGKGRDDGQDKAVE